MSKRYLTLWKYAELVGKTERAVYYHLKRGELPGARRVQRSDGGREIWAIPEDEPWPEDGRHNRCEDGIIELDPAE